MSVFFVFLDTTLLG